MARGDQGDLTLSFPHEQQVEIKRVAEERGVTIGEIVAEALEAWSFAHAERDGTPALEACAKLEGQLSPRRMVELVQEAMTWWLANPTLRRRQ